MRYAAVLMVVSSLMVSCTANKHEDNSSAAKDPLDKLGWRLGCQAWTFRNLSLFETIDTERTTLRCIQRDDAAAIVTLMTPSVSRWLAAWPSPITEEAVIAKIIEARTAIANRQALHFLIERRSDRTPMGWIRISRVIDRPRRGDLSYWLNDAYHGRGYASEAAVAAIAAAFDHLDLDDIEAGAQPENVASFAVMRRLGMEFFEERMVWASARGRNELCVFYLISRERLSR